MMKDLSPHFRGDFVVMKDQSSNISRFSSLGVIVQPSAGRKPIKCVILIVDTLSKSTNCIRLAPTLSCRVESSRPFPMRIILTFSV